NNAIAAGGAYVVFGDALDPGSWTPIHGTAVTDPAYGHDSSDPHDLGVIVLDRDAPVAPATLPAAGAANRSPTPATPARPRGGQSSREGRHRARQCRLRLLAAARQQGLRLRRPPPCCCTAG